jgi:hypothetical protein
MERVLTDNYHQAWRPFMISKTKPHTIHIGYFIKAQKKMENNKCDSL